MDVWTPTEVKLIRSLTCYLPDTGVDAAKSFDSVKQLAAKTLTYNDHNGGLWAVHARDVQLRHDPTRFHFVARWQPHTDQIVAAGKIWALPDSLVAGRDPLRTPKQKRVRPMDGDQVEPTATQVEYERWQPTGEWDNTRGAWVYALAT